MNRRSRCSGARRRSRNAPSAPSTSPLDEASAVGGALAAVAASSGVAMSTSNRSGSSERASGSRSTVRSAMQPGDRQGSGRPRRVGRGPRRQDAAGQLEPAAGLAVDGGADETRAPRGPTTTARRRRWNSSGMWRAELRVEHPDDDPDRGLQLLRGERHVQVLQIATARHDDGRGVLDRRRRAGCSPRAGRRRRGARRSRSAPPRRPR